MSFYSRDSRDNEVDWVDITPRKNEMIDRRPEGYRSTDPQLSVGKVVDLNKTEKNEFKPVVLANLQKKVEIAASLARIESYCGSPNAADGCRYILQEVKYLRSIL